VVGHLLANVVGFYELAHLALEPAAHRFVGAAAQCRSLDRMIRLQNVSTTAVEFRALEGTRVERFEAAYLLAITCLRPEVARHHQLGKTRLSVFDSRLVHQPSLACDLERAPVVLALKRVYGGTTTWTLIRAAMPHGAVSTRSRVHRRDDHDGLVTGCATA